MDEVGRDPWRSSSLVLLLHWGCLPFSRPSHFSQGPGIPEGQSYQYRVKKALNTSAVTMPWITRSPAPFSSGPTFSLLYLLLLKYLQKPFLVASRVLCQIQFHMAFLTPNSVSLYSSQVPCPCFHLLYVSFFKLSFVGSSFSIHPGLLVLLLNLFSLGQIILELGDDDL